MVRQAPERRAYIIGMKTDHYVYRCPDRQTCDLDKECRSLTMPRPLANAIEIYQKCPQIKRDTNGKKKEIRVRLQEHDFELKIE